MTHCPLCNTPLAQTGVVFRPAAIRRAASAILAGVASNSHCAFCQTNLARTGVANRPARLAHRARLVLAAL